MKLQIYAIYDMELEEYSDQIFMMRKEQMAIQMFSYMKAKQEEQSGSKKYIQLFHLGEYETETGEIKQEKVKKVKLITKNMDDLTEAY
jgi:hypothetical protein